MILKGEDLLGFTDRFKDDMACLPVLGRYKMEQALVVKSVVVKSIRYAKRT